MRLIALWHQSLQREKSRGWTALIKFEQMGKKESRLHRRNVPLMQALRRKSGTSFN
jgi:hypothetical protein